MKKFSLILLLLTPCISFASDHESGEALYQSNCVVCHGTTGGMEMSKRLAPPVMAVRMHYIGAYADENSFVAAVSDWVVQPDETKSRMRGAIRKFKIMPTLGVSKSDAEKIAAYIFAGKLESPEGMNEHIEERHGKKP